MKICGSGTFGGGWRFTERFWRICIGDRSTRLCLTPVAQLHQVCAGCKRTSPQMLYKWPVSSPLQRCLAFHPSCRLHVVALRTSRALRARASLVKRRCHFRGKPISVTLINRCLRVSKGTDLSYVAVKLFWECGAR